MKNKILNNLIFVTRVINNFIRDSKYGGKFLGHKAIKTRYAHIGAHNIANSGYAELEKYFAQLDVTNSDVLVDIGCGKGRVINFWLQKYPSNQIIGIEIDPDVAAFTSNRLSKYSNVSIICGSAIDLFPDKGTIFYLYNPFSEAVTKQFFDLLLTKTDDHREINVVYHNCEFIYVMENNSKSKVTKYSFTSEPGAIVSIGGLEP